MNVLIKPAPFLNIRVHNLSVDPSITGLCVGYERGDWRASQFAQHILEWLPEFTLKHSELKDINSGNAIQMIRDAARRVYKSEKFINRGEFGELFLHAAIRQVFNSIPAISKIYYKSAINDTVKGFDAVHVVENPKDRALELWLGEAKFYSDINSAINDVIKELGIHTKTQYLRDEFLLIKGKIDENWTHAKKMEELLSKNKSLDEIFARACISVLLTYDSTCLKNHTICDEEYESDFANEIYKIHRDFISKKLPKEIIIHLILLPLNTKERLLSELDSKLKAWQNI